MHGQSHRIFSVSLGWEGSLTVEHMPSMCEVLSLLPNPSQKSLYSVTHIYESRSEPSCSPVGIHPHFDSVGIRTAFRFWVIWQCCLGPKRTLS